MTQPIYKVFFVKFKEPWYKLTTEEQNKLMAQNTESAKQLGIEYVKFCTCAWCSEDWLWWGVEKAPDIEAVQKHAENLYKLNWFEYVDSKTYLGTEMPQT
jgi:chlorite dismutase